MGEQVKISVWWDIEKCMVPSDVRPHDVARNVSKVMRQHKFGGPISIAAYADTHRLPLGVQRAISSTGVQLHHIPSGDKDTSDKAIIVDMLFWALDNPPPAHVLLISGDRDFSNAVHRLRMKNYNILIAGDLDDNFSAWLLAAATNAWHWEKLARGEDGQARLPGNSHVISSAIVSVVPSALFQCQLSGRKCPAPNYETEMKIKGAKHKAKPKSVMKKLRCWLIYVLSTERARNGYDISSLRRDFEVDCNVKLDLKELGYTKLTTLLKYFEDVVRFERGSSKQFLIFPASEKAVLTMRVLKSWLTEILSTEEASNGYDISLVKTNFELDCDIKLDLRELGFEKIQDLISLFKDTVHIAYPGKDTCLLFPQNIQAAQKARKLHKKACKYKPCDSTATKKRKLEDSNNFGAVC